MFLLNRNLKRAVHLTGKKPLSGGAFCSYYKYNKTQGIKALYSDGHTTIKALRKSQVWRRATQENTLLRKCKQRYENIPKTYGVFPLKIGKYYYPGIVMQHIQGKLLCSPGYNSETVRLIIRRIDEVLMKKGIHHGDLHRGNIIVETKSNECYVLDFTYDLVMLDNGYS